jgi:hypothetical protein
MLFPYLCKISLFTNCSQIISVLDIIKPSSLETFKEVYRASRVFFSG